MNQVAAFMLGLTLGSGPAAAPEVSGLIATRVTFQGEARDKVGLAVLELLATCTHSARATEEDWLAAGRRCHVRVRYPTPPREVAVSGEEKIPVAEVIVTFPLASTGGIWVRSGDRFAYFSKFAPTGPSPGRELRHFQELLRQARPTD